MGEYNAVHTVCPFYRREDTHTIRCEGLIETSHLSQYFEHSEDKKRHKTIFCNEKYQNCEIYRILLEKYEDT